MKPTKEVLAALKHVQQYHPDARIVCFNIEGHWQFMNTDFNSFVFEPEVNIGLLEEASSSVPVLPYIYQQVE